MKNVFLIPAGLLSAVLCIACSQDIGEVVNTTDNNAFNLKSAVATVENKSNPFDSVGLDYRVLLSSYQSLDSSPGTVAEISEIVSLLMGEKAVVSDPAMQVLLSGILSHPQDSLISIFQDSGLSNDAKTVLSGFVANFYTLSLQPFPEAYNEILTIENAVNSSLSIPENDKRVILTVTSLARYSLYHECCEDTDWDTSVGNIVAAIAGAIQDRNLAIQYILSTRILQHEGVTF